MILIAGSAYTYTVRHHGRTHCLDYWLGPHPGIRSKQYGSQRRVSAHVVDLLDWFGVHPSLRWITPLIFRAGFSDFQATRSMRAGWHLGFNWPAFIIVMLLTMILVPRYSRVRETNNVMVLLKIVAILVFISFASRFIHPQLASVRSQGWPGFSPAAHRVFHLYRLRFRVDRGRRMQEPKMRCSHRHHADSGGLHDSVCRSGCGLTGLVPWQTLGRRRRPPVVNTLKKLHFGGVRLVVLIGALMGMISSLLVFQLDRLAYGTRCPAMACCLGSLAEASTFLHSGFFTWMAGFLVGIPAGSFWISELFRDLSNIGTLFALRLVAAGGLILRYREPNRPRAFRAPGRPYRANHHHVTCLLLMAGLPIMNGFDSLYGCNRTRDYYTMGGDAARCAAEHSRRHSKMRLMFVNPFEGVLTLRSQ